MPIVASLEPPAFAGEVQPRAALLWYEGSQAQWNRKPR